MYAPGSGANGGGGGSGAKGGSAAKGGSGASAFSPTSEPTEGLPETFQAPDPTMQPTSQFVIPDIPLSFQVSQVR